LSALIAPDALHTGSRGGPGSWPGNGLLEELWRRGMLPRELGPFGGGVFGPRTRSAGTSSIARESGGASMGVEEASALQNTLARIRERYALYFYLPEGVKPGDVRSVQVELSDAARRRYPGAEVRYRPSYLAPNGRGDSEDETRTLVSLPASGRVAKRGYLIS